MLRPDITVADLGELSTVHVSQLEEGANAWVESAGDYWILEKNSGAPVGPGILAPLGGSPSAGAANARWIEQALLPSPSVQAMYAATTDWYLSFTGTTTGTETSPADP